MARTLVRLLPVLVLLVGLFALIALVLRRLHDSARPGDAQRGSTAYRPRKPSRSAPAPDVDDGAPLVMATAELRGLRDAYSSAPIDAGKPLLACVHCQALLHEASLTELRSMHQGRCPVCRHDRFRRVVLAAAGPASQVSETADAADIRS